MATRTIPADQWISFLESFSRAHLGWIATVEVLDRKRGAQRIVAEFPLQGIRFDTTGPLPCVLRITTRGPGGEVVDHAIDMPLSIGEIDGVDGEIQLQIEPASGPRTRIHLRAPASPDAKTGGEP